MTTGLDTLESEARKVLELQNIDQAGLLNGAMDQMYAAQHSFGEEARHGQATLLLCFGAGGGILLAKQFVVVAPGEAGSEFLPSIVFGALAMAAFLIPVFVRRLYEEKMRASYELYVASVVHATALWRAAGTTHTHAWLRHVEGCAVRLGDFPLDPTSVNPDRERFIARSGGNPPGNADQIISVWMDGNTTRYSMYRGSFRIAARAGIACASVVGLLVLLGVLRALDAMAASSGTTPHGPGLGFAVMFLILLAACVCWAIGPLQRVLTRDSASGAAQA